MLSWSDCGTNASGSTESHELVGLWDEHIWQHGVTRIGRIVGQTSNLVI